MKKIEVTIRPDGTVEVEAFGYQGKSCEKATEFIEEMGTVAKKRRKPEWYQAEKTGISLKHSAG